MQLAHTHPTEKDTENQSRRPTNSAAGHQDTGGTRPQTAAVDGNSDAHTCTECAGSVELTKTSRGEFEQWYCPECGLVFSTSDVDHGPEWRHFDGDRHEPSRGVSTRNELLHDYGLGTRMGNPNAANASRQYRRLKTWQRRYQIPTSSERQLANAITEIRTIVSQLGYDRSVAVRASRIYRNAQSEDLLNGETRELVVGAAVLTACKEFNQPILRSQVIEHMKIDSESVQAETKLTTKLERVRQKLCRELKIAIRPVEPSVYVPLVVDRLCDIRGEDLSCLTGPTREIVKVASEQQWSVGKNPRSIVAGALYLTGQALCENPPTQKAVARAADLTGASVRQTKYEIQSECGETINSATAAPDPAAPTAPANS